MFSLNKNKIKAVKINAKISTTRTALKIFSRMWVLIFLFFVFLVVSIPVTFAFSTKVALTVSVGGQCPVNHLFFLAQIMLSGVFGHLLKLKIFNRVVCFDTIFVVNNKPFFWDYPKFFPIYEVMLVAIPPSVFLTGVILRSYN